MTTSKMMTRAELLATIEQARHEGWEELDLTHRGITELPPEIGQLTKLKFLNLERSYASDTLVNTLTKIPDEIGQLINLKRLDLNGNQLTALPESIGGLINLQSLNLSGNKLEMIPKSISQLTNLQTLALGFNQLTALPESIGGLTNLQSLNLSGNKLEMIPKSISQLTSLQKLDLSGNPLTTLPNSITQLVNLRELNLISNLLTTLPDSISRLVNLQNLLLQSNRLETLPESISKLKELRELWLYGNKLTTLPESITRLVNLQKLSLSSNQLKTLPESIGELIELQELWLYNNQLKSLPKSITKLTKLIRLNLGDERGGNPLETISEIKQLSGLQTLFLSKCNLTSLPDWIGHITDLKELGLEGNQLTSLPPSLARLENLATLRLEDNPLNPALQSAYDQGLDAVKAYLRSLEEPAELLYEAKLVLVGEGGVGKTTLLKALTGREPRKDEPTTHGVSIDIHSMQLRHPEKEGVNIQFNAWDFGGQEVYRVTHQFFFSRRSIYLVVWEPRMGVQQSQVEDWLNLIRLRVGGDARVIIVSTHARTGQRIARIDKPVFLRDYGSMIVDFIEVDSMEDDPATGEKFGIAQLKTLIAEAAKDFEHMGMPFNIHWKASRDELIKLGETHPRIAYADFAAECTRHGLDATDTHTLAGLMHDLGYIVYYGSDERLKDDVVLQPEWLTKAIGFVLEDRLTQEREGVLPDSHLENIWLKHSFKDEPCYDPILYPFFLRLMEKYDVSYRLEDGQASLVAQHVPQVRPQSLPWLPEEEPKPDLRRLVMVCVMDEIPPGLVPWMIVRTHDYAFEQQEHRLHWQKGMFLRHKPHGEALLELRGREFHLYAEAVWPEYFMNILRQTLHKLITDNWPGMHGRYSFTVPCQHSDCEGRFNIEALREFLNDGDETIRCQVCRTRQKIVELLFGFEDEEPRQQLARIEGKLDLGFDTLQKEIAGLESRLANYVMAIMRAMANEAKNGPRLFDIQLIKGSWHQLFEEHYCLRLWCEAEGCQHPVLEAGQGIYEFKSPRGWVRQVAPYARFIAGVLKTLVPVIAPAVDVRFGPKTIENLGISDHLNLMERLVGILPEDIKISDSEQLRQGVLSPEERSGLLAFHALLRDLDPHHAQLGLHRVSTYTGDFLWLCQTHYELSQPNIPEKIG